MAQELPVRLRVLLPAVDNAISGDAAIETCSGKTSEFSNTGGGGMGGVPGG